MVKNLLLIAFILTLATACKHNASPEIKTVETETTDLTNNNFNTNAAFAKAEFGIDGMTCEIGCARTIEKKIAKMEGVKYAKVDFAKKLAMVEYDQAKVTPEALEKTVAKVGEVYKVHDMKTVETFSNK